MPTLKNLSCRIVQSNTNIPFREYGTRYGDGVVESFIAVSDDGNPQPFHIHLTSNAFISQGLAAVVFIDGTYQCNRNRVNLRVARKGRPRARTTIDFAMRQKEKALPMTRRAGAGAGAGAVGLYMGRQWRFDSHNIVPDPPRMSKGNHFEFLGFIEVVVLRCAARNPDEAAASDTSSACEADVLRRTHARSKRPRSRPDPYRLMRRSAKGLAKGLAKKPAKKSAKAQTSQASRASQAKHTSKRRGTGKNKAKAKALDESSPGILAGLFDGASDPAPPPHHPNPHDICPRCQRWHQPGYRHHNHNHSCMAAPRPSGPTKRVHFDYGSPSESSDSSDSESEDTDWEDDYAEEVPDHPTSYTHNTPGLSPYYPHSRTFPHAAPSQAAESTAQSKSSGSSSGQRYSRAGHVSRDSPKGWSWSNGPATPDMRDSRSYYQTQWFPQPADNPANNPRKCENNADGTYRYYQTDGAPTADSFTRATSRPLHGPYGTYFSETALGAPCYAEEEPYYDVPQSYADRFKVTKQVQPGQGYLYTKKHRSPKYLDSLKQPYARFVFVYRTKEQLRSLVDLTLRSAEEEREVQKLQNLSKDELVDMLLDSRTANARPSRSSKFRAPAFKPPGSHHAVDQPAKNKDGNDSGSATNAGDDGKQDSTAHTAPGVNGAAPADAQGLSWNNDYQNPDWNQNANNEQSNGNEPEGNNWNNDDWNNGNNGSNSNNGAGNEDDFKRRDHDRSRCSTQSSRSSCSRSQHNASPDQRFSATMLAEGTDGPIHVNPAPSVLPWPSTSNGRWVLMPDGWVWQWRVTAPQPPPPPPPPPPAAAFAYAAQPPAPSFYPHAAAHPYQQYPSVRPGLSSYAQPAVPVTVPEHRDPVTRSSGRERERERERVNNTTTNHHQEKSREKSSDKPHKERKANGHSSSNQWDSQPTKPWREQQKSGLNEAPMPPGGW